MTNPLTYYAKPGLMTDPGDFTNLFNELSRDISELCRVVQGLIIHIFWAEQYGLQLPEKRQDEVQLRSVADKLTGKLDRSGQLILFTFQAREAGDLTSKFCGKFHKKATKSETRR